MLLLFLENVADFIILSRRRSCCMVWLQRSAQAPSQVVRKADFFYIFFKFKCLQRHRVKLEEKPTFSHLFPKKNQIKKIKYLHTGSAPTESSCEKSRLFLTCREENKGVAQKDPGSSKKLQYFWRTFRDGSHSTLKQTLFELFLSRHKNQDREGFSN